MRVSRDLWHSRGQPGSAGRSRPGRGATPPNFPTPPPRRPAAPRPQDQPTRAPAQGVRPRQTLLSFPPGRRKGRSLRQGPLPTASRGRRGRDFRFARGCFRRLGGERYSTEVQRRGPGGCAGLWRERGRRCCGAARGGGRRGGGCACASCHRLPGRGLGLQA